MHGKTTQIEHDGRTIFRGLPAPLEVGRYHSLDRRPGAADGLERSAVADGVVMAVRHRELPAEGVQFHPESVLTEQGRELLRQLPAQARPREAPEPWPDLEPAIPPCHGDSSTC